MKIKLLKPHEHGGIFLIAGETLELHQDQAEWLIAAGVAIAIETVKPSQKTQGD